MQARHFVLRVCLSLCLCFVFVSSVQAQAKASNETPPSLFEVSEVVPDVIDKAPNVVLEVLYRYKPLTLGQELTPEEVTDQPEVNWDADPDKLYTLTMIRKLDRRPISISKRNF